MRTFSEMDKHYDRHNEGICAVCGCTTERWKSICDSCRNEAIKKENEKLKKGEHNTCPKCGCTGYEIKEACDAPNPESATQTSLPVSDATQLKVGDWVEWCGDQYMVESAPPQSGGRYDIRSPYDELGCSVCPENITRKLSPSEVVIRIGCLSGTVERHDGNPTYWFKLRSSEYNYALISIEMLDAPTRELVEGLLKAQEEGE